MKKLIAVLVSILILLSCLSACGDHPQETESQETEPQETAAHVISFSDMYVEGELYYATWQLLDHLTGLFPDASITKLEYDEVFSRSRRPELVAQYQADAIIVLVDITTGVTGGSGLEPNTAYVDIPWVLTRAEDGLSWLVQGPDQG